MSKKIENETSHNRWQRHDVGTCSESDTSCEVSQVVHFESFAYDSELWIVLLLDKNACVLLFVFLYLAVFVALDCISFSLDWMSCRYGFCCQYLQDPSQPANKKHFFFAVFVLEFLCSAFGSCPNHVLCFFWRRVQFRVFEKMAMDDKNT